MYISVLLSMYVLFYMPRVASRFINVMYYRYRECILSGIFNWFNSSCTLEFLEVWSLFYLVEASHAVRTLTLELSQDKCIILRLLVQQTWHRPGIFRLREGMKAGKGASRSNLK